MGGNWLSFLVLFLALGGPAITWAVQKMREQADKKRQRALEQRRIDEELRTGRVSGETQRPSSLVRAEPEDRMTELQRLAERRQQQLRELRQRQSDKANAQPSVSGPVGTPPLGGARSAGAGLPPVQRGGIPAQGQGPLQGRRGAPQQQPRTSRQPVKPTPAPVRQQPIRDVVELQKPAQAQGVEVITAQTIAKQLHDSQTTSRPRPSTEQASRGSATRLAGRKESVSREVRSLLGLTEPNRGRTSLRSLIAATEVLSKPVSMRERPDQAGTDAV